MVPSVCPLVDFPNHLWNQVPISDSWVNCGKFACATRVSNRRASGFRGQCPPHSASSNNSLARKSKFLRFRHPARGFCFWNFDKESLGKSRQYGLQVIAAFRVQRRMEESVAGTEHQDGSPPEPLGALCTRLSWSLLAPEGAGCWQWDRQQLPGAPWHWRQTTKHSVSHSLIANGCPALPHGQYLSSTYSHKTNVVETRAVKINNNAWNNGS